MFHGYCNYGGPDCIGDGTAELKNGCCPNCAARRIDSLRAVVNHPLNSKQDRWNAVRTLRDMWGVDAGCYVVRVGWWLDGWWGQYATARLVQIASELGRTNEEDANLAERHLACMGSSDAPEIGIDEFNLLVQAADNAEAWMDANIAPEGYCFGWFYGEFYLWNDEDWEEVGSY